MVCTMSSQQAQQASHVPKVGLPVTAVPCLPTCQPSPKGCSAQLGSGTSFRCALAPHASGLQCSGAELASKP